MSKQIQKIKDTEKTYFDIQKYNRFLQKKLNPYFFNEVYFFKKRKIIEKQQYCIDDLEKLNKKIKGSKLVVFKIKKMDVNRLICEINKIFEPDKHFIPIINVENTELFVFPQLNYSSIYLLKAVFEKIFDNKDIEVSLNNEIF